MERVLSEELKVARFRAALDTLIREVLALRSKASSPRPATVDENELNLGLLQLSASPTLALDDQEALNERLARAREVEERAVLIKRIASLREEMASFSAENKKLRSENDEANKKLIEAIEESAQERSSCSLMSSLIKTLKSNQSELQMQLKDLGDAKHELEAAVKCAEETAKEALRALHLKVAPRLN